MARNMVLTYLHQLDPEDLPLIYILEAATISCDESLCNCFFCDWLVVFHVFYAPTAKQSLKQNCLLIILISWTAKI